jgi:DNA-binding LacI/PurR family transcriptional regulator
MENKMRKTLKDIANEAGVSPSMVSYILNRKGRITKESHKKILEIAAKYNYVPDANAKALVTGVSNNIGLIICKSHDDIFSQAFTMKCIAEFSKKLSKYSGWLSLYLGDKLSPSEIRNYLGNARLDGIVFMYTSSVDEITQFIVERGTPCVFLDGGSIVQNVADVACDDYHGISSAFSYLVSKGHKKIMFLSAKHEDVDPGDIRLSAYLDGIKEHSLQYKVILRGGGAISKGYSALKEYVEDGGVMPDAIIAANDELACGALKLLHERNVRIPDEIAVIGFDDANIEYNQDIGLSSVRQPIAGMVDFCVEYIYDCISKGTLVNVQKRMESELILRNTTRS